MISYDQRAVILCDWAGNYTFDITLQTEVVYSLMGSRLRKGTRSTPWNIA